jgi:hypothetical protein
MALGVPRTASQEEIQRAYRTLADTTVIECPNCGKKGRSEARPVDIVLAARPLR